MRNSIFGTSIDGDARSACCKGGNNNSNNTINTAGNGCCNNDNNRQSRSSCGCDNNSRRSRSNGCNDCDNNSRQGRSNGCNDCDNNSRQGRSNGCNDCDNNYSRQGRSNGCNDCDNNYSRQGRSNGCNDCDNNSRQGRSNGCSDCDNNYSRQNRSNGCSCNGQTPAMVYAQHHDLDNMYCAERALVRGTLFGCLDKPMCNERCTDNACTSQCQEDKFTIWELRLYLNTHPCDQQALNMLRKLTKQMDDDCGCTFTSDCDRWSWLDGPWPWEYQRCCEKEA